MENLQFILVLGFMGVGANLEDTSGVPASQLLGVAPSHRSLLSLERAEDTAGCPPWCPQDLIILPWQKVYLVDP